MAKAWKEMSSDKKCNKLRDQIGALQKHIGNLDKGVTQAFNNTMAAFALRDKEYKKLADDISDLQKKAK